MRLDNAALAGMAQVAGMHGVGDGPLDPIARRVVFLEGGRGLTCAGGLEGFMLGARADREPAGGIRGVGAGRPPRAGPTVGAGKAILMRGGPRWSCVGCHLTLVCPVGQVARSASPSRANWATSKPAAARACQD